MTRLFLVDDHPIVREGLRAMLEASGHAVVGEAGEPMSALAGIAATQPELVLMDLELGPLSGLDLLAALRARGDAARVLVFTMHAQPRRVLQALEAGVDGYLLKDAGPDQLLSTIAAAMAGQRPVQRELLQAVEAARGTAAELLSAREREIVERVALGDTSAQIAERLNLSPKTVDTYRSRAMAKLGVGDFAGLVRWAVREGLIDGNA